jgi:hypothetical protein
MLDVVIEILLAASPDIQPSFRIPMEAAPKSVTATFKSLLFSDKYSDIQFVCPDT